MRLSIQRKWKTSDAIEGELFIDGKFFCYTLERADGAHIPVGIYTVSFTYSPKFGRVMPLIEVPGREGIRFHSGNVETDSEGCVLLGDHLDSNERISGGLSHGIVKKFESVVQGQVVLSLYLTDSFGD